MTEGAEGERDDRRVRAATNQSIFREINESLEKLNREFRDVIPTGDFVCECADTECTERIGMTIPEYEQLRAVPTHFAVRHGHVVPEAERVVEKHVGYTVVEKLGPAGEYAVRADPRSKTTSNTAPS
jgi:hypothetical protein